MFFTLITPQSIFEKQPRNYPKVHWKLSWLKVSVCNQISIMTVAFFWTPGLGWKGPIKQGLSVLLSIPPSVFPSVSFLGIGSLDFSETQHGVRGLYIVVCYRARFFGKNPHWAKMVKNGPKNMVLGLFKKMTSLVFSRIEMKFLMVH